MPWTSTPLAVVEGTRLDLAFAVPDSLKAALTGRQMEVEWVELDEGYGPVGPSKRLEVNLYDDDQGLVPVDALNLRLEEAGMKRVRLKITTRSYPGAALRRRYRRFSRWGAGSGSSKRNPWSPS